MAETPEAIKTESTSTRQHVPQSWIVLTTWEQQVYPSNSDERLSAEDSDDVSRRPTYQTTITRLVFRVVPVDGGQPPAATHSPMTKQIPIPIPPATPIRAGWLFFQL